MVGLLLSFFHQATGISSITFYSNQIFTGGNTDIDSQVFARVCTLGVGVIGVLATITALIVSKHLGRKTILLTGEISM
jgi:hypothetical protein